MPELPVKDPVIPSLREWITQLQNTWSIVQKALTEARNAYKVHAGFLKKGLNLSSLKLGIMYICPHDSFNPYNPLKN